MTRARASRGACASREAEDGFRWLRPPLRARFPRSRAPARLSRMERIRIDAERPDPRRLQPAVEALARGEVIIYPTDTGYALGCAMSSTKAINRLRKLKGIDKKHKKPLTMLVSELSEMGRYGYMSNTAFRMVRRLLPGPYTMVVHATSDVPRGMKNRNAEVGVRLPDHRVCEMLVSKLGEPLLTGSLTPGEAEPDLEDPDELIHRFEQDVEIFIDSGPLWPEPSTVLRFTTDDQFEILRQGQGALPV